ncbi:hypothetical protein CDAR_78101 [Caerostris darwini]|uniref:Uncharacterized protein n=1 Tax=Caerostris darwini TaxID=1538125 RepID=A0AAV4TWD9_9ARAC|nr:hypothetical protein CDAR_78101 [Caerostris darwini]
MEMERTDCPSFQSQIAMDLTADLDSDACNSRPFASTSSSAAAEAMLTEPPCSLMPITAPPSLRLAPNSKTRRRLWT